MKSLAIILGLAAAIIILLTACVTPSETASKSNIPKSNYDYDLGWADLGDWKIIKSPLTGRCYEVFDKFAGSRDSSLGISEIPCSEYEKLKNKQ